MQVVSPVRALALVAALAVGGAAMFVVRGMTASTTETAGSADVRAMPRRAATNRGPAETRPVVAHGLPRAVASALAANRVVVVSVTATGARIDELAAAEARAGAALADARFVRIDALRNADVAPLAAKFGVRRNPTILVLRRPGDLAAQLDGFADRESVAQAVSDATAPRP